MRIICDAKDYYDSAQSFGQDLELVYVRKQLEMDSRWKKKTDKWPQVKFPFYNGVGSNRRYIRSSDVFYDLGIRYHIIGFCGNIYGALEAQKYHLYGSLLGVETKEVKAFCYDIDRLDKFIEENFKRKMVEAYHSPRSGANKHKGKSWNKPPRDKAVEFFETCKAEKSKYSELFTEYHCPAFVFSYWGDFYTFTVNPLLKGVEFFRVFDPPTAFQEIAMFWGGMAHPLKPIPTVPDKILAEAKGFDKWSFRKEPSKK